MNSNLRFEKICTQIYSKVNDFRKELNSILCLEHLDPKTKIRPKFGNGVNADICYPFLFREIFPQLPQEVFFTLALSGRFYFEFIRLIDYIMDEEQRIDDRLLLLGVSYYRKSLSLLYSLFSAESRFWSYFQIFEREYLFSILLEKRNHFNKLSPFSLEEFKTIAKGKAAMAKCAPAALAILADRETDVEKLSRSQDLFQIGYQFFDDLRDWRGDYENRRYSYLLTRVIYNHGLAQRISDGDKPDAETIGRVLYYSGAAEEALRDANLYMEKSLAALDNLSCKGWRSFVQDFQKRVQNLRRDISTIREKLLTNLKKSV